MTAASWITAVATVATAIIAGLIYVKQNRGATVSARFVQTREFTGVATGSMPHYALLVKNHGPERVRLTGVSTEPDILAGPVAFNIELLKDEDHRIAAAPSLATPPIVKVTITWLDPRGKPQSREQDLGV